MLVFRVARARPVVWFTVELDGHDVPIILSTAKLSPVLKGRDGVTIGELRPYPRVTAIYVDAAEPRPVQDRTLVHELLVHGVLWSTPLKRTDEQEEVFARAIADRAWGVLRALGFAWPKRPAGVRNLERKAGTHKKLP